MLNWNKHKSIMVRILKDIYSDAKIAPWLGFKGGTACLLFYDLPRYSVDLDFDLLDEKKKEAVFLKIKEITEKYAEIRESYQKRNTIFLLLSYGEKDHNIKIEISTRNLGNSFEVSNYLGIAMKVMTRDDMFANKLVALLGRKTTASRDIFDLHYFFSQNWDINEKSIKQRTGKSLDRYLKDCLEFIEKFNNKDILHGLGELVDEKQKDWVRKNLKKDLIFFIKACLTK